MNKAKIKQWIATIIGTGSTYKVAEKSGVNQATISRAQRSGDINIFNLIAIARAYQADVLALLVEVEVITSQEAYNRDPDQFLRAIPDHKLIMEFALRLKNDPAYWSQLFDNPVIEEETDQPPLNPDGTLNVTLAQKQGYALAADSSPWEPEPGDKDYNNEA